MNKPYSESCDQNQDHILSIISPLFSSSKSVLEIGSGTGQHAIYFAKNMPQLTWHTSDCLDYHAGINSWLSESGIDNIEKPFELNVSTSRWPRFDVDGVFTANSVHIMSDEDVVNLIEGVAGLLKPKGNFIIYGPFNYKGEYSSESNQRFDRWLKERDAASCIKHFETIVAQAKNNGMSLITDYEMPANNRILHFIKR